MFVAKGSKEGYKDLPPGVVIESSEEEGGPSTSDRKQSTVADSTTYVESRFTGAGPSVPLIGSPSPMVRSLAGGADQNMNPAMTDILTMGPQSAHMMNVLGAPHMSSSAAMVDLGLEGMPGGMFDWGEPFRDWIPPFCDRHTGCDLLSLTPRMNACCAGQWDTFFQRFSGGEGNQVQS